MATVWADIAAPAIPCRTRARISTSMVGAYAHMTDVAANDAVPTTNVFLRPKTSPVRAIVRSAHANDRR